MPLVSISLAQFLWIFIATNLMRKLQPNILFLKWLASSKDLTCYKIPDNEDLKKLRFKEPSDSKKHGNQSKSAKATRHKDDVRTAYNPNEFKIKSADLAQLELKKIKILPWQLQCSPYGDELEWVVDFSVTALITFVVLETIFYLSPKTNEYNISLLWAVLVIYQCLYILLGLTSIYFKNQVPTGERSLCLVSGCFFLLFALLVMALDGSRLDVGIYEATQAWTYGPKVVPSISNLLDPSELDTPPKPQAQITRTQAIVIKSVFALVCSIVGAIFTFPGFRFGQMYGSQMAEPNTGVATKIILNFNYLSPVLVVCLWIPSISRNLVRQQNYVNIDDDKFEMMRICVTIVVNLLRPCSVRTYTKRFLDSGSERINKLRYKGGTTTNKIVQVTVGAVNNYVNVVTLQYLLPILICLFTSIMYAALTYREPAAELDAGLQTIPLLRNIFGNQTFVLTTEQLLDNSRRILASDIPKNVTSFLNWWFHFAWLCTTTAGVVYHKYFIH